MSFIHALNEYAGSGEGIILSTIKSSSQSIIRADDENPHLLALAAVANCSKQFTHTICGSVQV